MKNKELNKLSETELLKLLEEKRVGVRQFRFDISGSKVKNIKDGTNMRKAVARILTELTQRKAN